MRTFSGNQEVKMDCDFNFSRMRGKIKVYETKV